MIDQTNYLDIGLILRNDIFGSTILLLFAGAIIIWWQCAKYKIGVQATMLFEILFVMLIMIRFYSQAFIIVVIIIVALIYVSHQRRLIGGR